MAVVDAKTLAASPPLHVLPVSEKRTRTPVPRVSNMLYIRLIVATWVLVHTIAWARRWLLTPRSPYAYNQNGLKWKSCGDNIDCSQLEVPLDYHNLSSGTATLALAKYPATNKTARIGTLLTNPGGPGGSGVNYIHRAGKRLSDLLDGRYDIVSWDPRGINGTTPRVECFASQTELDIFYANTHQEILPDARNLSDPIDFAVFQTGVRLADARNEVLARLCYERSGETLRHVGTATVVRDLERLYRVLEGDREPINFWGFSYGTVVGSYLVNMFPDRVGKVIIDGVVDPDIWANTYSYQWQKWDFADTEKDLENFYAACAEAGPDRCALAKNSSTPRSISKEVDKLIADLYEHPLPVPNIKRPGPLTASMVQAGIFTYLYRPREWPKLASDLASGIHGDGAPLASQFLEPMQLNTSIPARTASAIDAVTCVDTPSFDGLDKREVLADLLNEAVVAQRDTSWHFGSLVIDLCMHWKAREVERFTGPWNSTLSNTILVIGNTADPITPVQNARAVNKYLPKHSRLIVQDGSGHCSSAMTSLCTGNAIRDYFLDGKLPQHGIVCPTDEVLFPPSEPYGLRETVEWNWLASAPETYSSRDLRLLQILRELGKELEPFVSSFRRPRSVL